MTGQKYDYTNVFLLDYSYFKEHYKLIAINLRKKQVIKADPEFFLDTGVNIARKKKLKRLSKFTGLEITLTNKEITDIMKVIKPLEQRNIIERNYYNNY